MNKPFLRNIGQKKETDMKMCFVQVENFWKNVWYYLVNIVEAEDNTGGIWFLT